MYVTTFERLMQVEKVKDMWALCLALELTRRAQQAFAAMQYMESADYMKVKEVILTHYNTSDEMYQRYFLTVQRKVVDYTWS